MAAAFAITVHAAGAMDGRNAATSQPGGIACLSAHRWNLLHTFEPDGQETTDWRVAGWHPPQLWFTGDHHGIAFCNQMSWRDRPGADGHVTPVPQSGVFTMAGCDEALLKADAWAAKLLSRPFRYGLTRATAPQPPRLQLHFADGSRWELAGEPVSAK